MRKFLLIAVPVLMLFVSCRFGGGKRVEGNGNIQTEEKAVTDFNEVEVHGAIDVYVSQGELKPMKISGDENLLQYVELKQVGRKLEVRSRRGINLKPTRGMKIYLSSPSYRKIDVSGACDIIGETKISGDDRLSLQVSGAGDIKMDVDIPALDTEISGSGSILLRGKTRDLSIDLSGAGKASCFDLMAENVRVDIAGAGDADVYASMKLDAEVSGAGTVKYKGNAADVNQKVSGAGSVKKVQ